MPKLMEQLIKATDAQTAELFSARIHNENTAKKKTPTNNVFPPCTADNADNIRNWNNKVLAIIPTALEDLYDAQPKM